MLPYHRPIALAIFSKSLQEQHYVQLRTAFHSCHAHFNTECGDVAETTELDRYGNSVVMGRPESLDLCRTYGAIHFADLQIDPFQQKQDYSVSSVTASVGNYPAKPLRAIYICIRLIFHIGEVSFF
jgi:hypothetical protein